MHVMYMRFTDELLLYKLIFPKGQFSFYSIKVDFSGSFSYMVSMDFTSILCITNQVILRTLQLHQYLLVYPTKIFKIQILSLQLSMYKKILKNKKVSIHHSKKINKKGSCIKHSQWSHSKLIISFIFGSYLVEQFGNDTLELQNIAI